MGTQSNQQFAQQLAASLPAVAGATPRMRDDGDPASLPSCFDVSGLAATSIGLACAELVALTSEFPSDTVHISRRRASMWFDMTIRPEGWEMPPVWDSIAGLYRARDEWIRLHTNAPHHRTAALAVLDCDSQRAAVAARVKKWSAADLEEAIVQAGGCAAALRSAADWAEHPQGQAVAREPLIAWRKCANHEHGRIIGAPARPLGGLRILDCTRVLAGPVCTRFLAGFGADVLRIDPPGWAEANVEPEVTPGKRLGTLDLRDSAERQRFENLLASADIFVHGYRPGALEGLGLGDARRREINPGLIDVALCAYGWSGPWAERRGYDSLVQMSTGIVHEGMRRGDGETPTPLPVQALDHATGYLMAMAALRAVRIRLETGTVYSARLSLARTAELLKEHTADPQAPVFAPETNADFAAGTEATYWGAARRVAFPAIEGCPEPQWRLPARPLHSDPPEWST